MAESIDGGIIKIGNDWIEENCAGLLTMTAGTVVFDTGSNSNISSLPSNYFYDVEVAKSGGTLTLQDRVLISGNLTIMNGATFDLGWECR